MTYEDDDFESWPDFGAGPRSQPTGLAEIVGWIVAYGAGVVFLAGCAGLALRMFRFAAFE